MKFDKSTAADHRLIIASVYCQGYKMDNPVSTLMSPLLPPATEGSSRPTLRLTRGSSLARCLGNGEFKNICKNEVNLTAELRFPAADGAMMAHPIIVSVKREGCVGGFCGNMARYTAIIGRKQTSNSFAGLTRPTPKQ